MTITEIDEQLERLGCFDGGCLISPRRGGMRTNGGCHCVENCDGDRAQRRKVSHALQLMRRKIALLEAACVRVE